MRRVVLILAGLLILPGALASAQTSIDVLEQDLNQIKQEHQDASGQVFTTFLTSLDDAARSQDAALLLYQQAGGTMPDPSPVITQYQSESPDERSSREAQDAANVVCLSCAVELQCGLMRFAALFIQNPDAKGLHEAWLGWLKSAAQLYPQMTPTDLRVKDEEAVAARAARDNPPPSDTRESKHKGYQRMSAVRRNFMPPDKAREIKERSVRDSIISSYLGFNGWGDKDPSHWRVFDLPNMYKDQVLDPLRTAHNPEALDAWNTFIAMKSADQPDRDAWTQVDYPSLQFDAASDDFNISPSMEKLSVLVNIIKTNPVHPKLDEWIAQTQKMLQDFRGTKPAAPASSAPAAAVIPAGSPSIPH